MLGKMEEETDFACEEDERESRQALAEFRAYLAAIAPRPRFKITFLPEPTNSVPHAEF